ncbi:MAG: cation-translocating P-type ATPase, partial [Vicinamibacterales bacterium]
MWSSPASPSDGQPTPSPWYARSVDETAAALDVNVASGLEDAEAARRSGQVGPNELTERGGRTPAAILWEQATSTMSLVLLGAALIKAGVAAWGHAPREWIDAVAIGAIVILNVALGFAQEHRAERAMAALRRMAAPMVRVRRGGDVQMMPARALVPGDAIELEAGMTVPADARVIEAAGLQVLEAALTGESAAVEKQPAPLPASTPIGDRTNMLHFGTSVAAGRGRAIVVATGMHTELGRVAELLQQVTADPTPLQRRVAQLGAGLAIAVLVVVGAMSAIGVWRGSPALETFLAGVAVAVAAIPEGLPAVLTITLALGAQRMLERRTLVRRLPAVETLGSVTTICSDKTGTLTENRMSVVVVDVAGQEVDVTEELLRGRPVVSATPQSDLPDAARTLLATAVLCNDAVLQTPAGGTGARVAIGDPTEGALIVAAAEYGLEKAALERAWPRVAEIPFTSERKRMTTVHQAAPGADGPLSLVAGGAPHVAAVKGSADGLLPLTATLLDGDRIVPVTDDYRIRIRAAMDRLAARGLRVLGVAARPVHAAAASPVRAELHLESGLTFIGLIGLMDPPRPEVRDAVARCRAAGIRPVMITGDHPLTAIEIARQLGIAGPGDRAVTGQELDGLDAGALGRTVRDVAVFARVAPEHKLRIVEALQRDGQVVAMTGDGVNDAPALRKADIGVAMGITGTDVSKEAADMVITDDNFATIVSAVEEGRTIYDNVRRFVKYIVTSNSAEVSVMFLCQAIGLPMPMTTLQVLWMNLITDGVPGLALALEPTEP